ncbi:N-acetylglutamate synthase-like GNAT family acetyltransferase [Blastococcus colisei]|uniref:N-acetylglutamate synthase-like GNAT family acetyltransferase n=1 Tax=Blastococcus colisei TaxID=1564162 RepID=A0A543PFC6_9ACTN|nr:GNAT family N-acetyltransferase [Blastococcus colisei]TQN42767.1 N-acetylglutamate synthase-like GNAT family acetyltransferase [Blastococcus colisei]
MHTADSRTDTLRWVKDDDPRWDADRERVFATVPDGVFRAAARTPGERLSSDWWRVEDHGRVVGYGWLDDVWGDAEILLAVEEGARGTGAGAFALARLEEEASARGLNYVLNVVRDTHPDRAAVTEWFLAHGFTGTEDGRLRKRVGDRMRDIGQRQAGRPGTGRFEPDAAQRAAYDVERQRAAARPRPEVEQGSGSDLGPGAEESGGYVDQEQHRF